MKNVYLIAHKQWDVFSKTYKLFYIMDNPEIIPGKFGYCHTLSINAAKRFYKKEDVFEYLLNNPQQYKGAILLQYTNKYLKSIRENTRDKQYIQSLEGF